MYPRFAENHIRKTMEYSRVALVCGPRQSGKTTLVKKIAGRSIPFINLDDEVMLKSALRDPTGQIQSLDRAVIDEIQRVPELILAIKVAVDTNPSPGRFLLTGSADILTLPRVADSLVGRMRTFRLLPLSQAELKGKPSSFLNQVFSGIAPRSNSPAVGNELLQAVLAGGYPEAITLPHEQRQNWHLDYSETILQRDVQSLAQIEQLHMMPRLFRLLAEYSGQIANYSKLGATLGMNSVTTQRYVGILESMFLVYTLRPWYTNTLKRLVKTPKLHFLDSGLLASLKRTTAESLRRDRSPLGPVLETFVLSELLKLASWADDRYEFWHFRDKEKNEVDIVMENGQGQIVGIEVKAAATVARKDFAGLRRLAADCGDRFALGLILYDHRYTLSFGDRMYAAPVSTLWE